MWITACRSNVQCAKQQVTLQPEYEDAIDADNISTTLPRYPNLVNDTSQTSGGQPSADQNENTTAIELAARSNHPQQSKRDYLCDLVKKMSLSPNVETFCSNVSRSWTKSCEKTGDDLSARGDIKLDLTQRIFSSLHRDAARAVLRRFRLTNLGDGPPLLETDDWDDPEAEDWTDWWPDQDAEDTDDTQTTPAM